MIQVVNENPYTGGVATGVRMVKDFAGLSTDEKPTTGVVEGAFFRETDTARGYFFRNGQWVMTSGSEELPPVTAEDDGKALVVDGGVWTKGEVSGLPDVAGLNDGDTLVKVADQWTTQKAAVYETDWINFRGLTEKSVWFFGGASGPYYNVKVDFYNGDTLLMENVSLPDGTSVPVSGLDNTTIKAEQLHSVASPTYALNVKFSFQTSLPYAQYKNFRMKVRSSGNGMSTKYHDGVPLSDMQPPAYLNGYAPNEPFAGIVVTDDNQIGKYLMQSLDMNVTWMPDNLGRAMVTMPDEESEWGYSKWGTSSGYGYLILVDDEAFTTEPIDTSVNKSGSLTSSQIDGWAFRTGDEAKLYVNDEYVADVTFAYISGEGTGINYTSADLNVKCVFDTMRYTGTYSVTGTDAATANSFWIGIKHDDILEPFDKRLIPDTLPDFTAADEGKVLKIVDGIPTWVAES